MLNPTLEDLTMMLGDAEATGILEALGKIDGCQQAGSNTDNTPPQHMPLIPNPSTLPAALANKDEAQKPAVQAAPTGPFYYYKDFSTFPDPDSSIPVTQPGRIPNFPAKMYAILSRPDLSDIVSWLPHGRSWKVHKPREFEVKVIPTYFEHSKFSSFIRQANGWGFRRLVSKGTDRNSYYHEIFLRGMPHLLKIMKRPTSSTKPVANASTEPDLHGISAERPLPEIKAENEATDHVLQHCTFVEQQQMFPGRLITEDHLKPAALDYAAAAHFEPYRFFHQQPTQHQQHVAVPCATTLYHQAHPPPPAPMKAQPYLSQAAPVHHELNPTPVQTQSYMPQPAPVHHEHHPAPVQTQSYLHQPAPVHHEHHPAPVQTHYVYHEHHTAPVQTQSYLPQPSPVYHEHHPAPVRTQSQDAPVLHPAGCSFEIAHLDPMLFHEEATKGLFDDPFVGGLTASEFW